MATTEVTSWAVDLSTIGPIYPFVGTEVFWVVLGVAFWIGWHVWQMRAENRALADTMGRLRTPGDIEAALEGHRLRAIATTPAMSNDKGAAPLGGRVGAAH